MEQVVAWESSNWLVQDTLHGLGAFVTSSAAAGLAAVVAALIAAREVQRTRAIDNDNRDKDRAAELRRLKREDLWERFEWVVDRSTSTTEARKPVLKAARAVAMLVSLREAAKPLEDDGLVTLIQNILDHLIASITTEIGQ